MADYKLNGTLVNGTPFSVDTANQPDNITDFLNKMLKADWNTFLNSNGSVTAIHMPLVSSITVTNISAESFELLKKESKNA